jgi:hypothetical protein
MHVTRDGAGLPHIHERRNIASVLLGVQTVCNSEENHSTCSALPTGNEFYC